MRRPENMDAGEMTADRHYPTDEEVRASVRDWLDDPPPHFDAADFFEAYIDPAGPFRYCGSFDAWDGINEYLRIDPRFLAERLREYVKECC